MTTQGKLSIEDTVTISEHLDKGSSKRKVTCELYKIRNYCFYLFHVYLFDYPNKSWSQGGPIIEGALYSLVEKNLACT